MSYGVGVFSKIKEIRAMFAPKRPTAILTIVQDEKADTIHIDLKFEPDAPAGDKIMAYEAMLVGYTAVIQAIQPEEEESSQP